MSKEMEELRIEKGRRVTVSKVYMKRSIKLEKGNRSNTDTGINKN